MRANTMSSTETRAVDTALRTIVNAAREAMIAIGEDGLITLFNPAAEKMFGRKKEEMLGQPVDCLMLAEYRGWHREYVKSYFATGKPAGAAGRVVELRGLRNDGHVFPMDISLTAGNADGRPLVVAVVRDITARKRAEEALRKERGRAKTYLDLAGVLFVAIDAAGTVTLVNRKACEVLGYAEEEIVGRNWFDTCLPQRLRKTVKEVSRQLVRGETELVEYYENPVLTKSGAERLIAWHNTVLRDDEGAIISHLSSGEDITDRKRAEEALRESESRFRSLAESIPGVVSSYDVSPDSGRSLGYVGPGLAKLVGENAAKALERNVDRFFDLIRPEDRKGLLAASEISDDTEQPLDYEYRVRTESGAYTWVRSISRPTHLENGVTRWQGVLVDISQQKKAEEALREAHRELERRVEERTADLTLVNRKLREQIVERNRAEEERARLETELRHTQKMDAIGQLAAGVAHEFNNLLVGIRANARLLSRLGDELPETVKQPLEIIDACGQRAATLTQQLLTFAKKRASRPTVLDLNSVITETSRMLHQLLGERVTVETALASDLRPIEADRAEIEQAVLNIVLNAHDSMPDGGTVTIRTANVTLSDADASNIPDARPVPYTELVIADTGCGMSNDTLDRIFEPFFTTKPTGEGTGLGLSTVHADVTKQGGRIAVESQVGAGTIVRIHLPQSEGTPVESAADAARPAGQCPDGDETILVCDDDETVLDSFAMLLETAGYTVIRAQGGAEALQLASSHTGTISLLLTDVIMPGMNGSDLAGELTRQRPELKVLYMSGYASDVLKVDGPGGGGVEFIEKPSVDDALFWKVREVLDKAR